jgi:hypothetical protein
MFHMRPLSIFYQKWYHLSNMAVFAVGDFPDTQVSILHTFFFIPDRTVPMHLHYHLPSLWFYDFRL